MNKKEICSKCKEDILNCQCENFHPNLQAWIGPPNKEAYTEIAELVSILEARKNDKLEYFVINQDDCKHLYKYFLDCGYISYEFHPEVHKFITRLREFLES